MRLHTLHPAPGSKPTPKRLGRGVGSGLGKTSGKGHKGQHARAGGYHKVGFEGGQMPIQRRLPKRGFRSHMASDTAEVRLGALVGIAASTIDFAVLQQAGLVSVNAIKARVFLSGAITRAVTLRGIYVTKGARAAIGQAGGKVEE